MATTLNVLGKFPKKPSAVKRYRADFSEWLDNGELLTSVAYSVSVISGSDAGPDLAVSDSTIIAGTDAVFFVEGGLEGVTYQVTLHVITAAGQEDDFEIMFVVRE